MNEVLVHETLPAECSQADDCSGFGDGIIAIEDATVDMTGFVISENGRCGVTVHQASMDIHDGVVSKNVIGACVNAEEFDPERLMDNVLYRDNERRFDPNFDMPVPEPAMPVDWE